MREIRDARSLLAAARRYDMILLYLLTGAVVSAAALSLNDIPVYRGLISANLDLNAGVDLYARNHAWYKYSPSFALMMAPFAWLPAPLGAVIWSLLNFAASGFSLHAILPESSRRRGMAVALIGIVMVTNSDQPNLLVGGLMVFGMLFYWRERELPAALAIVLGAFVKVFPAVAGVWALKTKTPAKSLGALALIAVIVAALPLLSTTPALLLAQDKSWLKTLSIDYAWRGWSLSTMLAGFGIALPVKPVEVAGVMLAVAPILFRAHLFSERQRLIAAGSLLIMVILANHKSEAQTYVIAAMGGGIWYAAGPSKWWRLCLVLLAMLSLAPIYPAAGGIPADFHAMMTLKRHFFAPRLVPYVLLACVAQWELWQNESPALNAWPDPDRGRRAR